MHRPARSAHPLKGRALAAAIGIVCALTGCSSVATSVPSHPFIGHELSVASAPNIARSPFAVFDESGIFTARYGCHDVTGRFRVDGRDLRTRDVTHGGAVDCAASSALSPFTRILSQPALVLERDDDRQFSLVSPAGRVALQVGPALADGLGTTSDWTLAAGRDTTGTFSGYPATALRLTVGDGRLHSFDGCQWVSTFFEGTGLGGTFQIIPTVASGTDVQNCPDPTPSASRHRFERILSGTTAAEHSSRLLVLHGSAGCLVFELPPERT